MKKQPKASSRVAIYARVSRKDQSHAAQLRQLRRYATDRKWTVTAEYIDTETGASATRPQFAAMMQAAARHEFSTVLFWSLDRFSREGLYPTLTYLQQLKNYGVDWWNFSNPEISGASGEVFLAISAIWAKHERALNAQRTRAALETARARGIQLGRPRRILDIEKLQELDRRGLKPAAIARKLKVSRSTVIRRLAAILPK